MTRRKVQYADVVCLLPSCGGTFTPARKTQVYCTPAHYRADRQRRRVLSLERQPALTNVDACCALEGCEVAARGEKGASRFCADRHYAADWRYRTGRSVRLDKKNCLHPHCGASFDPRTAGQLYCTREHKVADRYRRNPQTYLDSEKRKRQQDPGFARAKTDRARRWVQDNPDRAREHFRRSTLKRRGVTPEGYEALRAEFSGGCWICRQQMGERTPSGRTRSLHVDHDHAHPDGDPLAVRGLLDTWCNTRLAIVEDVALVERIRDYLAARARYMPPPAAPTDTRRGGRWQSFGLTAQQFQAMVVGCGDRCELCREPESLNRHGARRPLSVDHDHDKAKGEPGFIRGLLCNRCNASVGVVENTAWFDKAVAYLEWAPPRAQKVQRQHPLQAGRRPHTRVAAAKR